MVGRRALYGGVQHGWLGRRAAGFGDWFDYRGFRADHGDLSRPAIDPFPRQFETRRFADQWLWSRTRHPNYFADALFWWGIYIAVIGTTPEAIWTIFAPILMNYLLVNVSGAKMLERSLIKKPGYAEYMQHTNRFVPRIF